MAQWTTYNIIWSFQCKRCISSHNEMPKNNVKYLPYSVGNTTKPIRLFVSKVCEIDLNGFWFIVGNESPNKSSLVVRQHRKLFPLNEWNADNKIVRWNLKAKGIHTTNVHKRNDQCLIEFGSQPNTIDSYVCWTYLFNPHFPFGLASFLLCSVTIAAITGGHCNELILYSLSIVSSLMRWDLCVRKPHVK